MKFTDEGGEMKTTKEDAELFFGRLFDGLHHCPSIRPFGGGWCVNHYGDLSTYDFDGLSRLVFLAHDMCMRASVLSSGPRMVKVAVWKRDRRNGSFSEKHPRIETALAKWREKNPEPTE